MQHIHIHTFIKKARLYVRVEEPAPPECGIPGDGRIRVGVAATSGAAEATLCQKRVDTVGTPLPRIASHCFHAGARFFREAV